MLSPKRKHGKENSPVGDSNIQCKPLTVDNDAKLEAKITASKKLRLDNGTSNSSKVSEKGNGLKMKELQTFFSKKVTVDVEKGERKMSEVLNGKNIKESEAKPFRAPKRCKLKEIKMISDEGVKVDITLPNANDLVNVGGIEFPADDVGSALQFLEFCNAFQQVCKM